MTELVSPQNAGSIEAEKNLLWRAAQMLGVGRTDLADRFIRNAEMVREMRTEEARA